MRVCQFSVMCSKIYLTYQGHCVLYYSTPNPFTSLSVVGKSGKIHSKRTLEHIVHFTMHDGACNGEFDTLMPFSAAALSFLQCAASPFGPGRRNRNYKAQLKDTRIRKISVLGNRAKLLQPSNKLLLLCRRNREVSERKEWVPRASP